MQEVGRRHEGLERDRLHADASLQDELLEGGEGARVGREGPLVDRGGSPQVEADQVVAGQETLREWQ